MSDVFDIAEVQAGYDMYEVAKAIPHSRTQTIQAHQPFNRHSNYRYGNSQHMCLLCSDQFMFTFRMAALYSYEYITTLDQEINHIWAKKWSLSTMIFAVNRYVALILQSYLVLGPVTDNTVSIKISNLLSIC
jgi:hypothetical protein